METQYFKEIFEYPIQEFKSHLENPSNERIFFSGKYGIGKTKFIEDFFKAENQQQIFGSIEYDVYRLFPINYSISPNEDIIRYIKYDLITELLRRVSSIEEIELKFIDTLPVFIKNNLHRVAAAIIYMIPKLGKDVVDAFEKIDKLKEEFLKFHNQANESSGDKMISYLERLELKEGSIYENDVITKIISNTIEKNKTKHSILVLDDMDRLDPEHVFRILNVFASHFDTTTSASKNKFNFDKIVIVGDFHNIRHIFHHKYGDTVDFEGYIDKFYSSDIYFFDNKRAIKKIIGKILSSIRLQAEHPNEKQVYARFYFRNDFLVNLLKLFVDRSFIGLRNVIKAYDKSIDYHHELIIFDEKRTEIVSWKIPMSMQIKLLRDFIGDHRKMIKILEDCLSNHEHVEYFEHYYSTLLFIVSIEFASLFREKPYVFSYKGKSIVIDPKPDFGNDQFNIVELFEYIKNDESGNPIKGEPIKPTINQFWEVFIDAVEKLYRIGYLR